MRWLWLYICGYVIITLKGTDLEAVLTAASLDGVEFGQVRRILPDTICCRVSVADWRRLRDYIPKGRVRCTVLKKVGVPFLLQRMARRKVLVTGGVLFLFLVYLLSSYVWFIKVVGYERIAPEEILAIVGRAGLVRGVRKSELEPDDIEKRLLQELPGLAWASLSVRGTLVTIEVAEKTVVDSHLQESGDLVASDPGIVLDVIPIRGTPRVSSGETVVRGQVLISGELASYDPQYQELVRAGQRPYLRADGIVTALVWYEERGRTPMVLEVRELTGNRERSSQLLVGPYALGRFRTSFTEYDVETDRRYWEIWGWRLPVGRQEQVFHEVEIARYTLDHEEAKRLAKEQALAALQERIPGVEDGEILSVTYALVTEGGVEYMEANVLVEMRKNIAEFVANTDD
ncbi:MAG TPA: sporulation protein YqfD [Firmicutes bacterium]|nr:sporulation protein YqfD [Bacillota bacterium]